MKLYVPLLALTVAALSSCSTAYKTGQTPDDVYYSPARPQDEYVRVEKNEDRYYRGSEDYYEDRFLRMRLQDRYRWSALDDYYFNNTYAYNAFGNYYSWNNPWNNYWTWNYYYNPYCGGMPYYPGSIIIKNPRTYTPPSRAVVFNPNSYANSKVSIRSRSLSNSFNNSNYNNSNRRSNNNSLGQSIRKVFSNENNSGYNSGSNNSTPSRSYTPSSSSNNSSSGGSSNRSSGGSGGGGVSRPPR